jgi:hypothetical protein
MTLRRRRFLSFPRPGDPVGYITVGAAARELAQREAVLDEKIAAALHATFDPVIDDLTRKMDTAIGALRDADLDAARPLSAGRGSLRRPGRAPRPPQVKDMLKEEAS